MTTNCLCCGSPASHTVRTKVLAVPLCDACRGAQFVIYGSISGAWSWNGREETRMKHTDGFKQGNKQDGGKGIARRAYHKACRARAKMEARRWIGEDGWRWHR